MKVSNTRGSHKKRPDLVRADLCGLSGTREAAAMEACSCRCAGESSTGANIRNTMSTVMVHKTRSPLVTINTHRHQSTEHQRIGRLATTPYHFIDVSRVTYFLTGIQSRRWDDENTFLMLLVGASLPKLDRHSEE